MTEDQLRELAGVSAQLTHVTATMEEIKGNLQILSGKLQGLATRDELNAFITRAESNAKMEGVERRIGALEAHTQKNSAGEWLNKVRNFALTITSVAAAVAVVAIVVRGFDKIM
jgi:hypothetical protein